MAKTRVSFTRIISGIADYDKESVLPDSVSFIRHVNYRVNPHRWTLFPRAQKESGSVVVDLPMCGDRVGDNTYVYGDAGNIYKRTLAGAVTLVNTVAGSSGNGLKYYGEDDFLYYTTDTVIGRYGRIGGTPTFVNDFLGAEGGLPLNTASLDTEAGSSHYATAADDATLSITGDITLETQRKFESLPDVDTEMVLISKWTLNSDERSYKFSVVAISGVFGDGGDGAKTISTSATETPTDSACSGTADAYTLTATNASFATDDIILIHQTRGTGAGTRQRNRIVSYTLGTITLETALNFSYNSTGANKAQVRVLSQYTNVTVNSGKTWTAKAWNGTVGGILSFIASGTTTVTGNITASAKGYRGGDSQAGATYSPSGEGTAGASATVTANPNGNGGGSGYHTSVFSGGGGGGHSAVGTAGTLSVPPVVGTPGQGGLAKGSADLTTMVFGGGGAAGCAGGSSGVEDLGGDGGDGGGCVFIYSAIITITGTVTSAATNGTNGSTGSLYGGGGAGGGAGGSILIKAQTATLGTNLITAAAGTGGTGAAGGGLVSGAGGAGAVGRIHLDYYTSYTGTTIPTLTTSEDSTLVSNLEYFLQLQVSSDGTAANSESLHQKLEGFAIDSWEHLAVSWDASESLATFYWDGNLIGTATGSETAIYDSTSLLGICASFDASGDDENHFDGKSDSDRVWNDVRTESEIQANMGRHLLGTEVGLQAYYRHNSALTDDSPNTNTLTHVNTPTYDTTDVPFPASTTRQDIDQSSTATGDTTATATTISEAAGGRQTFVPAKDPQKSISIFVADTGDDPDWKVTVHDAQNRTIATKTIVFAEMTTGEIEFTFSTPWRPIIGATYHFHVTTTTTTGAPDVVSEGNNDLDTAQFYSYYQFLVTDGDYHPIEQIINKLGIGNGRYLATWNATTYDPHELTFPSTWRVRCLALWREYLAIGCWRGVDGDDIEDYDQGIIFFWDGTSDTYNFYINVPEGGINSMIGSQGTLHIVAGYQGDLLKYTGGDKAIKVKRLPNLAVGEQIEVHPQAMTMWKTLLRLGAGVTDSDDFNQGIYTWGSLNENYPDSLSFDYAASTNNTQDADIQIGMLLPVAEKLLVGWKDNLSYGLDSINLASTTYADGSIEFLIRDEGGVWKEKQLQLVRADFEPLASSEIVGLQYKLDRNSAWSVEETETTALKKKLRVQVKGGRHKEYQLRLNMRSTTTTSPEVVGVTAVEDTLGEEQMV